MRVYLSLGSNLGDRAAQIATACRHLEAAGLRPVAVSRLYETEPQGRVDQPWFLNAALAADTDLGPAGVLQLALGVEAVMGRQRLVHWGPRVIDIDVLLCGDEVVQTDDLVLPHPRLHERAFALVPLAEIAPGAVIPGRGSVAELAAARRQDAGQGLRLWGPLPGPAGARAAAPAARGGTRATVLERLQAAGGRPLSGASLAQDLGVSRSAVWKHVRRLRAGGYPVLGTAGTGYVLAESGADLDALSSEDLVSARRASVGRVLHVLDSVDSTNRLARQLGLEGTPAGTAIVAEEQTRGRGRRGRTFTSPRGGVYLSVVLRPALPPAQVGRLTLLGAVAAAEALELCAGLHPAIKWPNDLLLPGGKVAGILCELVGSEEGVDFVVLGIGVNVRSAPPGVGATSLWAAGAQVGRAEVARALLDRLDQAAQAFAAGRWTEILAGWRRRAATLGAVVQVSLAGGEEVRGRAVDVTLEGALLVETPDGVRTIYAGDLTHLRPAGQGAPAAQGES